MFDVQLTAPPKEFGYVLLVLFGSVFVHNLYMSFSVGAARKKFGVKYPTMYADKRDNKDADAFNCVQRAHQNSLETLPSFYAMLLVAGTRFPITAAIAGAVYVIARVVYFAGYSTGDPAKRQRGAFYLFGLFTLMGCIMTWAIKLLTGKA